ncbi:MAG TPA: lysophospholipid acyltransferase family protein [Candidatus Anoxymicrobiaceae bacterium]
MGVALTIDVNQMLFYELLRFFIGPMIKLSLKLKIEGQDNVPDLGPAVMVCNHRCVLDPAILAYSVPNRYISFAAAAWSWKVPGYRLLHEWTGAFPLTLSGGKGNEELSRGLELLAEGELVGIFPEGGEALMEPGKAEKITRFKTGFARLALQARAPVIPCAVIGLSERRMLGVPGPYVEMLTENEANREYSSVVYRRAACRIGVPVDLGELYDEPVTKDLLELVSTKVRAIVIKLYNGEDLDRFLIGEVPFDFANERVGGGGKLI